MHDAFEPVPILEKLPLQIDCLAAWGESEERGAEAGATRERHGPFTSLGTWTGVWLCLWAPVGRRPKGNWDEGVQSIVDCEGS